MPTTDPVPGALSLVIAITGHRDLHPDDAPRIKEAIAGLLADLRREYPNTPLLLLSGLAEGADRVAVQAAQAAAVPYVAVLPMPATLYRTDFETEESDTEFQRFFRDAARRIELPLVDGATPEQVAVAGDTRNRQYETLGRFLVRHSQILIAVWDQERSGKKGGTSHVVAMKLREETPSSRLALSRMNRNGAGPVYVLPARRKSSAAATSPTLKCDARYPESSTRDDYEESYKLLDQFNEDVRRAGSSLSAQVVKSRSYLFDGEQTIGLSAAMEWVANIYSWADALAIRFSSASLKVWQSVFFLLALSGVALVWVHTMNGNDLVLLFYYACLVIAIALIFWEWKAKRRGRHEDYRALAEALRVQFFWMAAGLKDMASEQYLRKQAGEMVWIRDAMSESGLYSGVPAHAPGGGSDRAGRLRLAHTWVKSQAKYFFNTKQKHEKKKRALTAFAWVAVAIGLVAPLVGLLEQFREVSHAVAGIAMWWAALTWNYMERRNFVQEARQYSRMYNLFHDADEDLKKSDREEAFDASEETIRDLGCEALTENGDWLSMHREKKLSPGMVAG